MRVSLAANCKLDNDGLVAKDSKHADIPNPAITAAVAAAAGVNTASLTAGDATFTALPDALDVVYMSAFKKATCPFAREDATADTFVTTGGKVRLLGACVKRKGPWRRKKTDGDSQFAPTRLTVCTRVYEYIVTNTER